MTAKPQIKLSRTRTDGRKSLLVYIRPDVIKNLKKTALDEDRNAYEIVEDSIVAYLSSKRGRKHNY